MGIAANELRVGNWYKNKSDDYPFNQIKYGHEIDYVAVYCEPIPLTEEWLLKLCFNHDDGIYSSKNELIVFYIERDELECEYLGYSLPIKIKHVHQLQNLYFALTGEELTINELLCKQVN